VTDLFLPASITNLRGGQGGMTLPVPLREGLRVCGLSHVKAVNMYRETSYPGSHPGQLHAFVDYGGPPRPNWLPISQVWRGPPQVIFGLPAGLVPGLQNPEPAPQGRQRGASRLRPIPQGGSLGPETPLESDLPTLKQGGKEESGVRDPGSTVVGKRRPPHAPWAGEEETRGTPTWVPSPGGLLVEGTRKSPGAVPKQGPVQSIVNPRVPRCGTAPLL
jgi:hypothetical protein